jgi:hypothetical protein
LPGFINTRKINNAISNDYWNCRLFQKQSWSEQEIQRYVMPLHRIAPGRKSSSNAISFWCLLQEERSQLIGTLGTTSPILQLVRPPLLCYKYFVLHFIQVNNFNYIWKILVDNYCITLVGNITIKYDVVWRNDAVNETQILFLQLHGYQVTILRLKYVMTVGCNYNFKLWAYMNYSPY